MSATIERSYTIDTAKPISLQQMRDTLVTGDKNAHRFVLTVFHNGEPKTGMVSVTGYYLRPDGKTILLDGDVERNRVSVLLPENCYGIAGQSQLVVRVSDGEAVVTIFAINIRVMNGQGTEIIDPGGVVPSLDELRAKIAEVEAAGTAARSAAADATAAASTIQSTVETQVDVVSTPLFARVDELMDAVNQKMSVPEGTENGAIPRSKDGSVEWVYIGQPTDAQTEAAISSWLATHPEATTTVADGSISREKISGALLHLIANDFVTPEMFGAVADGKTNDTTAINAAIDTGKPVLFTGKYACNLVITKSGVKLFATPSNFGNCLYPYYMEFPVLSIGNGVTTVRDVTIDGLSIYGKVGTNVCTSCLTLNNARDIRIYRATVGYADINIDLRNAMYCKIYDTDVRYARSVAINQYASHAIYFDGLSLIQRGGFAISSSLSVRVSNSWIQCLRSDSDSADTAARIDKRGDDRWIFNNVTVDSDSSTDILLQMDTDRTNHIVGFYSIDGYLKTADNALIKADSNVAGEIATTKTKITNAYLNSRSAKEIMKFDRYCAYNVTISSSKTSSSDKQPAVIIKGVVSSNINGVFAYHFDELINHSSYGIDASVTEDGSLMLKSRSAAYHYVRIAYEKMQTVTDYANMGGATE